MLPLKKLLVWAGAAGLVGLLAGSLVAGAQTGDGTLFGGMKWRLVGPFRGGRVTAVAGVAGEPNTYYFGGVAGGVWKTTNGGITWEPVFDSQGIASIGAIAVAPSNSNILYVGTGEADPRSDISYGDGVYRSDDAGATWRHVGLEDSRHIGKIVVDPKDPNVVLVAALGHAYGPNEERGVFLTHDGGRSWTKVLYRDANTGAVDLARDDANPQVIYASLWNVQRPPWSTYAPISGPGGGLFRSNDGGQHWAEISGRGLPPAPWGRSGIAIAPGTDGRRIYALIDAKPSGLYRSDDAGATWSLVGKDPRIIERAWYFCGITVDPRNPDIVYVANVGLYRSDDGGQKFQIIKGAPGGDDYHQLWVSPSNSHRMILGSDQGSAISVDDGKTWSSWYNQPTGQFYHVSTDNAFPYRIYGSQQDSGSAGILSRTDTGRITFRDWAPVGAGESGYVFPDPRNSGIVYGGEVYGGLHRFNRRTHQVQDISPREPQFGVNISQRQLRFTWTSPLAFAPWDPATLYMGAQFLLRTRDGGDHWETISPDLTGAKPKAQRAGPLPSPTIENTVGEGYGVIYTIAPSPLAKGQIWIGTDTGRIQLTRDEGEHWSNVTPAGLSDWSKISIMEASHFDAATAYAAVDRHRIDDVAPYIYRTHDFGKTWAKITNGLPTEGYVHVVREDPVRRGLLYAGTELGVFVSFDDGGHWQSLQINLPVTSIRDLAIHGDDLIAATHGRAFWVLDDVTPLRQMTPHAELQRVHLYRPETAYRLRTDRLDTPLPREFPGGHNPPDGAIIDYVLSSPPPIEVTLQILDSQGKVVRTITNAPIPKPAPNTRTFTDDWLGMPPLLTANTGMNRYFWDLHYDPPAGTPRGSQLQGPWALPGNYQVRLLAAGQEETQPLTVQMDPRVKTSREDLRRQFAASSQIAKETGNCLVALREIHSLEAQLAAFKTSASAIQLQDAAEKLSKAAAALRNGEGSGKERREGLLNATESLVRLNWLVNEADAAPTSQAQEAIQQQSSEVSALLANWQQLKTADVRNFNEMLRSAGKETIDLTRDIPADFNPLSREQE